MAGHVCVMFRLLVFTDILFVSATLNTHMHNVALDKLCNISSRHVNLLNLPSGNCSAAINGNTNTVLNLSITPPNCIHTALNDTSPFWWVDLGQEVAISVITIFGRTGFINRMICVNVSLDGKLVKGFSDMSGWSNSQYDISVGRRGRVVNITKDCNNDGFVINICEVQSWVCDDGWYGDNCTQVCGHCAGGSVCDKINGSCTSCDTGFQLPMCTDNVALDKLCNISSRHVNRENLSSGNCSAAINGNTNTVLNLSINPPNCIHTALNDSSPFWWVDLGQKVAISVITIYGRTNFTERMICVNVFLDGNVVKRFNDRIGWNNNQYNITVGRIGQVVNITKDCNNDGVMINICEVEVWVCDDGWYGDNCTQVCGHCAGGSVCDKINGSCTSCDTGFQLPKCTECAEGRYGVNCTQTCGHCSNDSTCDKVNGSCGSCKPGYQLPLCKACSDGWYGVDCSQTCRHCGNNSVCDNKTGSCLPYDTGFKPPLSKKNVALDKVCNISSRHVNKENVTSGNCSAAINGNTNTVLNHSATPPNCIHTALNDLSPFWWVDLGQEVAISVITIYGRTDFINRMICVNVSLDGKVLKRFSDMSGWSNNQYDISVGRIGQVVNITKDCDNEGVMINICEVQVWVCDDGWYGDNCTQVCGHCVAGSVCDKINGNCTSCHTGFQLPMCTECADGWYGVNCTQRCGDCFGACDKVNRSCGSCSPGFLPPLCTEPVGSSEPNFRLTPVGAVVEIVSTVTVAAVVVMIIVVVVVVWLRRTRQLRIWKAELLKGKDTNTENEYSVSGSVVNISQSRAAGLPEDTGASSLGSQNQKEDKTPVTARKSLAITETTVNKTIYQNLELKSNVPIHSHDSQSLMTTTIPDKEDMETANNADEEEGIYNTEETYALYRSLGSSSIFDDLQKSLLDSLTSGKLEMEFAEFSKEMRHPHEAGRKSENLKKNRFKALCAYDHSRVVLRRPKGDSNTDYINASYIKGYLGEKAYIATQGPRSHTVDDLWWMVWQENVTQIIMLTSIKEDGKDKCEEYWQSAGTTTTYGHVTVTALKTDSRADFVVRYFVLESKQGGDQRTVSQYHYMVWPDHGVPSTCSLVSFWRYVKARAQGAIPVVHCSAGVGRTGTYIALDIASDMSSRGHDVNVKDIVRRLREDRTLMVQTAEQYKFLHEVILEEYTSRGTRMTFDQFDLVFPNNSRINKEFKVLTQMGQFVPKSAHTITESQENVTKHRIVKTPTDGSNLVHLSDHVPVRNQNIRTVHMSSFRKRQGLILTQLPLPDTVVDMWRLIDGWDVNTIVSLGHKDQSTSVKNNCRYWPETAEDTLTTGQHTVSLTSSSALGPHLTCYNLSLATKATSSKQIRVLCYDDWNDLVPGSISDFLRLIDILESWHVEEDISPLVVQCDDGMTRSGMFCALYDIINQARHDQEIDVYLSVRHVQKVIPQAITTEMEYHYCYRTVQEYKLQTVYQNS